MEATHRSTGALLPSLRNMNRRDAMDIVCLKSIKTYLRTTAAISRLPWPLAHDTNAQLEGNKIIEAGMRSLHFWSETYKCLILCQTTLETKSPQDQGAEQPPATRTTRDRRCPKPGQCMQSPIACRGIGHGSVVPIRPQQLDIRYLWNATAHGSIKRACMVPVEGLRLKRSTATRQVDSCF